jgi:hypothetical protein
MNKIYKDFCVELKNCHLEKLEFWEYDSVSALATLYVFYAKDEIVVKIESKMQEIIETITKERFTDFINYLYKKVPKLIY